MWILACEVWCLCPSVRCPGKPSQFPLSCAECVCLRASCHRSVCLSTHLSPGEGRDTDTFPGGHSLTVHRGDLTIQDRWRRRQLHWGWKGPFLLQHPCFWALVFFHPINTPKTHRWDRWDWCRVRGSQTGRGWVEWVLFSALFYSEARRAVFCHQEVIHNTHQPSPISQELLESLLLCPSWTWNAFRGKQGAYSPVSLGIHSLRGKKL